MFSLSTVQQKIPCLFEIKVNESNSSKKWNRNAFQVIASDKLNPLAINHMQSSVITEKIDGTSCYISQFQEKCWLWVRRERKPTKSGDRRCKLWNTKHETEFEWDSEKDLKDIPENWIPMSNVEKNKNGKPKPSSNGHIPGWIPVDETLRDHCWHLSAVDLCEELILILRPTAAKKDELEISVVKLKSLEGKTLELIGTNINGNPYGLGSKAQPFHIYVEHGVIPVSCDVPIESHDMTNWFKSDDGQIEGIVWHSSNGMFKIHRHHLSLPWPVRTPKLSRCVVRINLDETPVQSSCDLIVSVTKNNLNFGLPLCEFVSRLLRDEN